MPILKREPELHPAHIFELELASSPWWVAHVRSRQEKNLARQLLARHVPHYLPQQEKTVLLRGRRRTTYLPLFTGYLFFRGGHPEREEVLQTKLVAATFGVLDQSLLDRELRQLRELQLTGEPLVIHPYLAPGDEVRILDGCFKGCVGRLIRERGKLRLAVAITLLRQSVALDISRESVAMIRRSA